MEFNALFRYILANRDGIDNWHNIPSPLRRSLGGRLAPVRSGSGVIEKNIEVRVGRRFKRQGPVGLAPVPSISRNCSGFKPIPLIGRIGGTKPL
jgi:hypothetical protein